MAEGARAKTITRAPQYTDPGGVPPGGGFIQAFDAFASNPVSISGYKNL